MNVFCMYFLIFFILLVLLHISNVSNIREKFANNVSQMKDAVNEQSVIQSPWMCSPVYVQNADRLEQKYVIARKDMGGRSQCARFDVDSKCTVFDDLDKCNISMVNSDVIAPYTCKPEDATSSIDICKQLKHNTFQCRQTNENEYIGVRKNENDIIECLGRSPQSCAKFQDALACNKGLQEIKNDRYLQCGRMMYELYGHNGYSDPDNYCAKLDNIL